MSSSESEYENETILKDDFSDFENNEFFENIQDSKCKIPESGIIESDSDSEDSDSSESELETIVINKVESVKSDSQKYDENNLTPKYLFKYEYIKIISKRVAEIRNFKKINFLEAKKIAKQELKEGKLNYTIKRYLPNNIPVYYKLNDLYIKK